MSNTGPIKNRGGETRVLAWGKQVLIYSFTFYPPVFAFCGSGGKQLLLIRIALGENIPMEVQNSVMNTLQM